MPHRSVSFWLNWPHPTRILFVSLLVCFVAALASMWYNYFQSPAPTIHLQTIQEADLSEMPVHRFQKGIFELVVAGNNYILFERLLGAPIEIHSTAAYLFVFFLLAGMTVLLTVFTTLSRFYYLVSMGLFILFVVSLRMELLLLFGQDTKVPTIVILAVYVLTSFYFYYFAKSVTFTQRLAVFALTTTAVALLVYFFSTVALPFFHLAATGMMAGILVSLLFILMVAHEIVAGFIFIVTQGAHPSKSLRHFLIITLIYLVNLGLAYSVKFKFLTWDIVTIDLFLLLTLSSVLGIWGIRQRQKQFHGILDVEPYGVIGFVALATVSFASLSWFFQSANDPITAALSDVIIFSHIGYGLIFLLYIISNFIGLLASNKAVHKVLYNPNNMPYFTFRLGGLITTLAFTFYNTWQVPVQNAIAGYYIASGDLYLALGNTELAKAFYTRSGNYGYGSHHGNYALANLEGSQLNTKRERQYYEQASSRRPTEMSILNWAQTFQTDQNNLQGLLTLKDGLEELPNNGALQNSLGYLFWKGGAVDSAQVYFQKAESTEVSPIARTNLMAMGAKLKALPEAIDTLLTSDLLKYTPYRSNLLARLNATDQRWNPPFAMPTDTVLSRSTAAWINNYLVHPTNTLDTATLNQLTALVKRPINIPVREPLLFALALAFYEKAEVQKAFRLLEEVAINSPDQQGKYNNILALWTLEQNEPDRALGYLHFALTQDFVPARVTHAVVLTEAKKEREALPAWDSLLMNTMDSITLTLGMRMRTLLTLPARQVFLLSDEDKYAFARYRVHAQDSSFFSEVVASINDPDFKAKALLERSQLLFSLDRKEESINLFQQIRGLELSNKGLYDEIRHWELMLLADRQEWVALEERLEQKLNFADDKQKNRIYFEALLANAHGDTSRATPLFRWLGTANPFFEEGVVAAAYYFSQHGTDRQLAYNLLIEALQNHPGGLKTRKAYCLEAARIGLDSFALASVDELKRVMSSTEFTAFQNELNTLLDSHSTE